MSKWTSKHAILRDLSEAQGLVPVEIEGIVSAEDKPPPLAFTEETEEEFYSHYGDGDASAAPDFGLIKQMLHMVSDVNIHDDNEENSQEMSPELTETISHTHSPIENKNNIRRKNRNAAFESILEMDSTKLKMQALIGHDITQTESCNPKPTTSPKSKVTLEPFSMFKKKTPVQKPVENKIVTENKITKPKPYSNGTYKPSGMADEYYKQYVDRLKFNESIREDIWARAERKMKEIEAKKKLKQDPAMTSENEQLNENKNLDVVRLTQHRHLLQEDCVLCEIMSERGYNGSHL